MTTALDIIEGAFSNLGIQAAETPLEAFQVQDGLKELNDLFAEWEAEDELIATAPVSTSASIVRLPRWAVSHAKCQLALKLASNYSEPISAELTVKIAKAQEVFDRKMAVIDTVFFPNTLPTGSGNNRTYWISRRFFKETQEENF